MKKCKGCGVILQNEDKDKPGYTPKADSDYCQRCFRLIHYDDLTLSMKKGIDPSYVFEGIQKREGIVLWVVDLFDFEASMIEGLNRHLLDKDIIMVATKRDLLPETFSDHKLLSFIKSRLKELNIYIKGVVVTGKYFDDKALFEVLNAYSTSRNVIVMGKANAGKSTLLNRLMGSEVLSASRYPGTTLDFNEMEINGYTFIDTPGIEVKKSMVMNVSEADLKVIMPSRSIKPLIFQCYKDQSFILAGLAVIYLYGCQKASSVFYTSDMVTIHRTKAESVDELWKKHYGALFKPVALSKEYSTLEVKKMYDKMDIVIDGLGWVTISGNISKVVVKTVKGVNVTFRKAMI